MAHVLNTARSLGLAIDASPQCLVIVDAEGTIVLGNRALERQFGYARGELPGQSIDRLLPEATREIAPAGREGGRRDPVSRPLSATRELIGRKKDGSPVYTAIEWRPLPTADGCFMLGSLTDKGRDRLMNNADAAVLEDRFEFERFVDELITQFNNLPSDQILEAVTTGLRRLCEQLGLDRGTLFRIGPDALPFASLTWTTPRAPSTNAPLPAKERFPWSLERIVAGDLVSFSTTDEIPHVIDRASYVADGITSAVSVPLWVAGQVAGAIGFSTMQAERRWSPDEIHRMQVIATVFAQALARRQREEALQATLAEAERLKEQVEIKSVCRRRETSEQSGVTRIVGRSAAVRQVLDKIQQVAGTDSTVLLFGETGTGKELFATQIHETGNRRARHMVRVNCAAIPTTLIESELFGREKGAFTGSLARQIGRFEMAHQSTLFLDEIGDLPPDVQVKLLRVLEERKFERLGSPRSISVDARIIAATHRNLEELMAQGTFREDLYYRFSVFPVFVPPLRERVEDIPLLVWRFVEEFCKAFGKRIDSIDADSLAALQQYPWPGNVRELRNVVERAMIGATRLRLTIAPPQISPSAMRRSTKLIDVEKEHIRSVVESTGWRIRGVGGAADRLGLRPTTLETRMAKLGLRRPGPP